MSPLSFSLTILYDLALFNRSEYEVASWLRLQYDIGNYLSDSVSADTRGAVVVIYYCRWSDTRVMSDRPLLGIKF